MISHSFTSSAQSPLGVQKSVHAFPAIILIVAQLLCCTLSHAQMQASSDTSVLTSQLTERYLSDGANLLNESIRLQIIDACAEIEKTLRIRIFVKTEILENIADYSKRLDSFFAEWIRSIGIDKRGILLYAAVPRDSLNGKFSLRVGIGLKYLITREMGEKILNQVILPSNAENNDGRGFLEGILTIKRMLLDELRRENQNVTQNDKKFDLLNFLWNSKEIILAVAVALFLCYSVFFVERCPRCNSSLQTSFEILKDPGRNTLGLRRRLYLCPKCGFTRRKKEPIYPPGSAGFWLWLLGTRRNVRVGNQSTRLLDDLSSNDRHTPPE